MPILLSKSLEPVILARGKIVAIKIEVNQEHWVDVWISYGNTIDGVWTEWADEKTGRKIDPTCYHIEDGVHPLSPGASLRRCPDCYKWYGLELVCTTCGAGTLPYDGLTRAMSAVTADGATVYAAIRDVLYDFLLTEELPDPVTGELALLLDGTVD